MDKVTDSSLYNIKEKTWTINNKNNITSSELNIGNNLDIKTSENVMIQASKITTGSAQENNQPQEQDIQGNLNITTNNLYILAGQEYDLTSREIKKTRTLMFNNSNETFINSNIINSELSAKDNNFNFNIANSITTSYDKNDYQETEQQNQDLNGLSRLSFAKPHNDGDLNNEQIQARNQANNQARNLAYLDYINSQEQLQEITIHNPLEETHKYTHNSVRGLTETGTALVAVGAVAAVIVTGGVASTFVGAVGSAVASTAASTAAISATNTSMNAEGDFFKQGKDIGKQTVKDTTSDESLKNMAVSAAIAAASFGIGQWMSSEGVNPSLKPGTMENSKVGINVEKGVDGNWYQQLPNKERIQVSSLKAHTVGTENPAFQLFNTAPGSPSFAGFHDAMNFPALLNQATIAPYYALSQCAAMPTICSSFPDIFIKIGSWGQIDTNLDIYK